MCSIMGYQGTTLLQTQLKEAFDETISRGPDMQRIECFGEDVTLGFERLAIMGLTEEGMQPFTCHENAVVCNGEIYGFRKIKKELIEKNLLIINNYFLSSLTVNDFGLENLDFFNKLVQH